MQQSRICSLISYRPDVAAIGVGAAGEDLVVEVDVVVVDGVVEGDHDHLGNRGCGHVSGGLWREKKVTKMFTV